MHYKLNFKNETYPVEDINIPAEFTLAQEPVGKHFSFVSPVQLAAGQSCALRGDSGGYQLLVNACFGFAFSSKFLVLGIIGNKETAVASTS